MAQDKSKTTSQEAAAEQQQDVQAQRESDPTAGGGEAKIVKADEEVSESMFASATETDKLVVCNEDVLEEFFYPGTTRPSYRVLYTKGQTVRQSAIDAHNAGVKARKAAAEGRPVDEDNPAGIDSTTIASGTRTKPVESSSK
jgi:hypothetical protein